MCIFCKIANGEIPSYKIYEDDLFLAFLDLSQATFGHTLVIPKKHSNNIFDIDEETSKQYMNVIHKVANILKEKLNVEGINIVNNSGEIAGQSVMHIHFHLIPRYKNDDFSINFVDHSDDELIRKAFEQITK